MLIEEAIEIMNNFIKDTPKLPWKDIERIINDDKELYMDWWKYGLYE